MNTLVDDALRSIADFAGGTSALGAVAEPLSARLASALGWQQGPARLESFEIQNGNLKIARGYLGPQRAAVFATNGASATKDVLPDAALFAYHSSVHWGVVADEDGAVIFNSHWIRNGDWFQLPEIRWSELDRHHDVLRAVSPREMASGRLQQIAEGIHQPERLLTPVDDALVIRLAEWRREALRFGSTAKGLDEDLHVLFAQLFVLRTVEDRRLARDIPSLDSTLVDGRVDFGSLDALYDQARHIIQSQLFLDSPFRRFPDFILAGIISSLYTPSELPQGSQRYNFAWIDADVLGRAYEKYLSNVFRPLPPSPQLSLFEQPMREVELVSVKKSGGIFYTPEYLVGTLTDQAVEKVLAAQDDPDFIPRVADFACGSGPFLVEAVSVLLRHLRKRDPNRNWARELIEGKYVVGIDVDPRAVQFSRLSLWTRIAAEPDPLPLPSFEEVIVEGDSLGEEVWATLPTSYDIVVGNPPFIATGNILARTDLRRFRTAQGRFDYAHLFVELAISRLSPGGILGLVVPNRLFRNRDAGIIRQILVTETEPLAIIDFGHNEVFAGTSAYIGAIVARKRANAGDPNQVPVRVVLVSDISQTQFLGGSLTDAILSQGELTSSTLSAFDTNRLGGSQPWVLLSPEVLRARVRLEEQSRLLGEVVRTYQGIRTGANDIFIVQIVASDGFLTRVVNQLGESALLESELLHPVVFGSDIQRYDLVRPSRMLLYPYRQGVVLSEVELREEFPATYRYLNSYRSLLAGRSSIATGNPRWYELVRKRDEEWLTSRKLLTRDLATRTSFALDESGQVFLVGGSAVLPPDPQLALPLLAYLNSSIANEYLLELTPAFRGAFQKFEPQHLNQLPLPLFIVENDDTAFRLGELAWEVIQAQLANQETQARKAELEIDRILAEATARPL
ncbi:MAG: N-6 DNA methylase [Thermomicrobiales bacterium]